jgi:hypothetical protein
VQGKREPRTAKNNQDSQAINSSFNILYTNADCLNNKKDELQILLSSLTFKPSIIIITEVNSKHSLYDMNEAEFNIDGYDLFGCNIGKKPYRGIIMYIDNKLSVSQSDIQSNFSEYLILNIKDSAKYLLTICAIYLSPSSRLNNDVFMFELLSI